MCKSFQFYKMVFFGLGSKFYEKLWKVLFYIIRGNVFSHLKIMPFIKHNVLNRNNTRQFLLQPISFFRFANVFAEHPLTTDLLWIYVVQYMIYIYLSTCHKNIMNSFHKQHKQCFCYMLTQGFAYVKIIIGYMKIYLNTRARISSKFKNLENNSSSNLQNQPARLHWGQHPWGSHQSLCGWAALPSVSSWLPSVQPDWSDHHHWNQTERKRSIKRFVYRKLCDFRSLGNTVG